MHAEGRRFKSDYLHHKNNEVVKQFMLNYLECSNSQFETATRMARNHDIPASDFPTDLLYIAYTKYSSDARHISGSTIYAFEIYFTTVKRRDEFKQELIRRGVSV